MGAAEEDGGHLPRMNRFQIQLEDRVLQSSPAHL